MGQYMPILKMFSIIWLLKFRSTKPDYVVFTILIFILYMRHGYSHVPILKMFFIIWLLKFKSIKPDYIVFTISIFTLYIRHGYSHFPILQMFFPYSMILDVACKNFPKYWNMLLTIFNLRKKAISLKQHWIKKKGNFHMRRWYHFSKIQLDKQWKVCITRSPMDLEPRNMDSISSGPFRQVIRCGLLSLRASST